MEFSRGEYWSGFPFPTLEDLRDPGIEPMSPAFPALAGRFVYNLCNTWCIPEFFCCFGLAWFRLGLEDIFVSFFFVFRVNFPWATEENI